MIDVVLFDCNKRKMASILSMNETDIIIKFAVANEHSVGGAQTCLVMQAYGWTSRHV